MYIGVSGIDGSGKTTLINIIDKYIKTSLKRKTTICDAMKPGCYNSELKYLERFLNLNESYDEYFSPEMINLGFCADLYENYYNIIQPKLLEGNVLISHRSRLCCRVYSEVFSEKLNLVDEILKLVPFPDILFYLKTSPEVAIKRVYSREKKEGIPVVKKENIRVFEKACKLYDEQIEKVSANIIIINGDMEIEKIEKNIKKSLIQYL